MQSSQDEVVRQLTSLLNAIDAPHKVSCHAQQTCKVAPQESVPLQVAPQVHEVMIATVEAAADEFKEFDNDDDSSGSDFSDEEPSEVSVEFGKLRAEDAAIADTGTGTAISVEAHTKGSKQSCKKRCQPDSGDTCPPRLPTRRMLQ